MHRALVAALLSCTVAAACHDGPTLPPETSASRSLPSFLGSGNAPDALPNVIRLGEEYGIQIGDPSSDLVAVAGLPADPQQVAFCGGPEGFQIATVQDVGALQDVAHRIGVNDAVNLHVYRFTGFQGVCASTPIARGVGRLMITDNDVFASPDGFPGANIWGFTITGPVTLTDGTSAHLIAHNRFFLDPQFESMRRVFRHIELSTR